MANIIWTVVAKCFGATNIPKTLQQCYKWCEICLPYGKKFHVFGGWGGGGAVWRGRGQQYAGPYGSAGTKLILKKKRFIKNPLDIICHISVLE